MVTNLIEFSVSEQIKRIVAEAAGDGRCISASGHAKQILRACPKSELSAGELANEIMMAAARAGVAVEIGEAKAA